MAEYIPNKYVKAMLLLDALEQRADVRDAILADLGFTAEELKDVILWLALRGSEQDLRQASLFFDTKR